MRGAHRKQGEQFGAQISCEQGTRTRFWIESFKQRFQFGHQKNDPAMVFSQRAILITQESAAAEGDDTFSFMDRIVQRGGLQVAKDRLTLPFQNLWNGHPRLRLDRAVQVDEWQFEIV